MTPAAALRTGDASGHGHEAPGALLLDAETRGALWRDLAAMVEGYITGVAERPVAPVLDPAAVRAFAESFTFAAGEAPRGLMARVADALAAHQVHTPHPCYFGLFNPAPTAMGIAADMLVATLNPQLAAWSHSPLAVEIERHLVRAFGEQFGFARGETDGTFTTGGAEANTTALLCALLHRWPEAARDGVRGLPADPVCYISGEGHHSFVKAARMTGLGERALREVPVRDDLTIDPERLRAAITADRAEGRAPFLVVASAGTTGAGAIDPLGEMAQIAADEGLWLHVDAAWAGAVALVPHMRHLLNGIERADSITFDPHKWLSVPMGAGLLLTRHPHALARAFAIDTGYMPREGRQFETVDPYAHSAQWSRRFSGLKLFLSLAEAGWPGYAAVLARQIEMGTLLRQRLIDTGWRIVNSTPLPIVCFTALDEAWPLARHQEIADAVIRSGRAWISTIVAGGRHAALRACITNYRTAPEHIEILIDALRVARAA